MRTRPVLLAALGGALVLAALALWLLVLRPVDPAGSPVPAPITVEERSPARSTPPAPVPPTTEPPAPAPTDVVPPPPVDDDDDDDDDLDDDDDDDDG